MQLLLPLRPASTITQNGFGAGDTQSFLEGRLSELKKSDFVAAATVAAAQTETSSWRGSSCNHYRWLLTLPADGSTAIWIKICSYSSEHIWEVQHFKHKSTHRYIICNFFLSWIQNKCKEVHRKFCDWAKQLQTTNKTLKNISSCSHKGEQQSFIQ